MAWTLTLEMPDESLEPIGRIWLDGEVVAAFAGMEPPFTDELAYMWVPACCLAWVDQYRCVVCNREAFVPEDSGWASAARTMGAMDEVFMDRGMGPLEATLAVSHLIEQLHLHMPSCMKGVRARVPIWPLEDL